MNDTPASCQSCGLTIESGPYCEYCTDDTGALQSFDERVARMSQFMREREPTITPEDAKARTLAYMRNMPAWRDHPRVKERG